MTFKLACGDVMPGCSARFEADDEDALLREVAEHARAVHGLEVTPEIRRALRDHITAG